MRGVPDVDRDRTMLPVVPDHVELKELMADRVGGQGVGVGVGIGTGSRTLG